MEKETIESRVESVCGSILREKEREDIARLQSEIASLKDEVWMLIEIIYKIKDLL